MPHYSTKGSAGMDLRANITNSVRLKPLERALIKTGIFMEIPLVMRLRLDQEAGWLLKMELQF